MLLIFAVFALVGTSLIFLKFSFWRRKCCQNLPGKPPNFFNIFADLPEVLFYKDVHLGVVNLFRKRNEMHQKDKLFCVWASYLPFVCLVKAEAVKDLMEGNKMNEKGFMYEYFESGMGKGLITSSAAKAKFRRRLLTPCFHPDVLRKHMTVFNDYSEKFVNVLKEETSKEFSCIDNIVPLCTLDIIIETMFGTTFDALENGSSIFKTGAERSEEIVIGRIYKPWMWPDIIFWNSKDGQELKKYLNILEEITSKIIQEKKDKYLRGEIETHIGKHKALLDLLLEKTLETQELSDEDIREEVNTFVLAGYETIASAIIWALFLIGHHPDVQAKIQEELDQVFGEDTIRPVTEMDLRDLRYLDCVLKETARLYPAVPQFVRKATEDTNTCGYVIPKGASVIVLTYFLHRDEDVFPEPEKFDPDRFLPENFVNIPAYGYIPFSSGPRSCPGYKFAEMELRTIMCYVLRNFTVESLSEREKIELKFTVALHPFEPIRFRFRTRALKKRVQF